MHRFPGTSISLYQQVKHFQEPRGSPPKKRLSCRPPRDKAKEGSCCLLWLPGHTNLQLYKSHCLIKASIWNFPSFQPKFWLTSPSSSYILFCYPHLSFVPWSPTTLPCSPDLMRPLSHRPKSLTCLLKEGHTHPLNKLLPVALGTIHTASHPRTWGRHAWQTCPVSTLPTSWPSRIQSLWTQSSAFLAYYCMKMWPMLGNFTK